MIRILVKLLPLASANGHHFNDHDDFFLLIVLGM